jgi:penicillin-binding protein 2
MDNRNRRFFLYGIIGLVGLVFIVRLFFLQVVDKSYTLSAESNVIRKNIRYPARGLIYDRKGKLMVHNEAAYDVMVVPQRVHAFDTAHLASLLHVTPEYIEEQIIRARRYSRFKPSVLLQQISKKTYAYLEEKLYQFPGFYVQSRSLRKYPQPVAAHVLGYVGEISRPDLKNQAYYNQGDYIGISGLEKTYERYLRGRKGIAYVLVDVHNRVMGSYAEGRYDSSAVKGSDLQTTIDLNLQKYGESLMANKKGSIVAIEPATGEILALVSSPTYNPNLLVGRIRGKNYLRLQNDTLNPLFNRALMAQYSPGSTFKLMNALIGLQENQISRETYFECNGVASWPIKCGHNHDSPLNLPEAIEQSCNPYFWKTFRNIISNPDYPSYADSYKAWRNYVLEFGFSQTFDTDLANEKKGFIPEAAYYDRYYSKGHWNAMTIRSLSIGQGEILVTPLQLANFVATIANRGYYYPPHLVKKIDDREVEFSEKKQPSIHQNFYEPVIEGMHRVYHGSHGTARWYRNDTIAMCGKTGTVENPHGDDHGIFIAFAPKDNPKIALAVVVENSGFGATWAAPVATLMMEKYLTGQASKSWIEKRILNADLIHKTRNEDKRK